jgi:hypothetical protein
LSNEIKAKRSWQVIPGEGSFSAGAKLQKLTRYLGFDAVLFKKSRNYCKNGALASRQHPVFHDIMPVVIPQST